MYRSIDRVYLIFRHAELASWPAEYRQLQTHNWVRQEKNRPEKQKPTGVAGLFLN